MSAFRKQPHEQRELSNCWDDDGALVIRGRLPGEVGALLVKALESAMAATGPETDVTAEPRVPVSERRADAMAEMAESYLVNGPAESSSADRYQVMPHVTAETSKRLCCDASISRLVEDGKGEPLSIGRKSQVIPPAMRRALRARDRQCRFPGCVQRYFIDGRHIQQWADGGETRLDNLGQLCRHHRRVHEGGFSCEKDPRGTVVFQNRAGELIPESGYRPPPAPANFVRELNKLADRFIHATTCVTRREGETMDRHLAVGLLCDLDSRSPG